MTNRLAEIDSQIAETESVLSSAQELLESLREERKKHEVPPEPSYDYLLVTKMWEKGGKPYTYLLLRSNGLWTMTGGNTRKSFTWEELYRWIKAGYWHGAVRPLSVNWYVMSVLEPSDESDDN